MSLTSYRAAPPRVGVIWSLVRSSIWRGWRRPTLPRLKTQYHRRGGFSRPSSEWDRVYCPSLWPPDQSKNQDRRVCFCINELLARICPVWLFGQFACPGIARRLPALKCRIFTAVRADGRVPLTRNFPLVIADRQACRHVPVVIPLLLRARVFQGECQADRAISTG